jgi:paraquat-inducible protein B
MSKRASPTVIGAFVLGAVALAVLGVVVFGSGRFFRETNRFVSYFDGSVNGLRTGAAVKFKGVEVGSVGEIRFANPRSQPGLRETRIAVILDVDADRIRQHATTRSTERVPAMVERFVQEGLRAQLNVESLVTGVLYVALDDLPEVPIQRRAMPSLPYQEIPTAPTTLQEIQRKATVFLAKLDEIDVAGLLKSIQQVVDGVDGLVNSPRLASALDELDESLKSIRRVSQELEARFEPLADNLTQTSAEATRTIAEARATLANVRTSLDPASPLVQQLATTLDDVSQAARAMRNLADELERDPSALIRGRDTEETP